MVVQWPVGRAAVNAFLRTGCLVVLLLSLVLMHGLGLSHTGTPQSLAEPTVAASSIASDVATGGEHAEPTGSATGHGGDQGPGPGHSEALPQACLAVLTALVMVFALLLLTPQGWSRYRPSLRALRTPPLWDPTMWWVHPRPHVLCVMRT